MLGYFLTWAAILASLVFSISRADATTITAATCSATDVQNAINAAVDQDTILIPAGSCLWTSGVTISGKGIKVQGAGSGRIVGRSTSAVSVGTGTKAFETAGGLNLSPGQVIRVWRTGDRGTFMLGTVIAYTGTTLTLNVTSTGGSGTRALWLIATQPSTTITNNSGSTLFAVTEDTTHSVEISRIKFAAGSGSGVQINVGNSSGGKPVLIHDCWMESGGSSTDSIRISSARGVVWNCSFDSSPFSMAPLAIHMKDCPNTAWTTPALWGAQDTTGTGNFYVESSDFHAFLNATDNDDNCNSVFRHVLFNNAGFGTHGADTSTYGQRHFEVYDSEFVFNGFADGTTFNLNWWFFVRGGTFLVTDTILPNISSQDYGNKLEVNMTVMNLQRSGGPHPCWGANSAGTQYPAPRQVGMGRVTGTGGSDGITYNGDSEPIYLWNNTGAYSVGTTDFGGTQCANPDSSSSYIVAGRDYFVNTPKPGYSKYPYPHPLTNTSASSTPPVAPTDARLTAP